MKLIRFLRSIEWSAVLSLALAVAATVVAFTTKDMAVIFALVGGSLTLAVLLKSSNRGR